MAHPKGLRTQHMLATTITPAPSSTKPVRVLVIEGQALFGKALCQVLAADVEIEVVGDADSVANAQLRRLRPDLIVLDLDGHHVEFSEAMRTIRELAPQAQVERLRPRRPERVVGPRDGDHPPHRARYVEQRDQREAAPFREDGEEPP